MLHMANLLTMDDVDSGPTIEELSKAITEMASRKTLGSNGIPSVLLRSRDTWLLTPPQLNFSQIMERRCISFHILI